MLKNNKNLLNLSLKLMLGTSLLGITVSQAMAKTQNHTYSPSSYIVYDFKENKILDGKNMNSVRPIASITKLMTANVFLENRDLNNCSTEILPEDKDILKHTTTKLPRNTKISCKELLKAMLVHSDNYAAHALSRMAKMNKEEFIEAMNNKAKELGMKDTYFSDSSGLSSQNHSTVLDLVKLSKYSLAKNEITKLSNMPTVNVYTETKVIPMRNTNKLVREGIKSAVLSKTGFTNEAGYNLVFVNRCHGHNVAVISLNNVNSQQRSNFTVNKLNQHCDNL